VISNPSWNSLFENHGSFYVWLKQITSFFPNCTKHSPHKFNHMVQHTWTSFKKKPKWYDAQNPLFPTSPFGFLSTTFNHNILKCWNTSFHTSPLSQLATFWWYIFDKSPIHPQTFQHLTNALVHSTFFNVHHFFTIVAMILFMSIVYKYLNSSGPIIKSKNLINFGLHFNMH
jgi:hypothetical protein